MPDKQVILIHPPFCMPDKPYISTAVLFSFLRAQGINTAVLDLNIEFYREYLSPDNIDNALDFIEKRFKQLDDSPSLDSLEIQEYLKLAALKNSMTGDCPPFHLLFTNCGMGNTQQFKLFAMGLNIVNTMHFPESLEFLINTGYIRYRCPGNKFSSNDIIEGINKHSIYSDIISNILLGYLEGKSPEIIGISISFPDQIMPAFHAASVIKKLRPEIHVCLGGTFVSSHMRSISNISLFDYVDTLILDEGEAPLLELCRCLNESKPYDHIPGLIFKKEGRICPNGPAISGMKKLTQPDYSSVDLARYLADKSTMALLFRLSQGCYWHRCSFCRTGLSFVKNHIQAELSDIAAWIKKLVEDSPVRILHFTDDAADPELLEQLSLFLLENGQSIAWITNMRFDFRISLEKLKLYKQAGCRGIFFGLESCNERVLIKMKKGISMKFVEKTLNNCSKAQIPVNLYMIVGFPTETEEEALESFATVSALKKKGLVRQVVYNVFEISCWSDISLNPQDYEITEIVRSSTADLDPPITEFVCSGMHRSKAEAFCREFIGRLARIAPLNDTAGKIFTDEAKNVQSVINTQYDTEILSRELNTLYGKYYSRLQFEPVPGFRLDK